MDISSLEQAAKSLEERLSLFRESNDDTAQDACLYHFKRVYEIGLKMMKRYLKETSCNPAEIEKYTFNQIIKAAHEISITSEDIKKWKIFRECRVKADRSYEEDISGEIMRVAPSFLNEINYIIGKFKECDS